MTIAPAHKMKITAISPWYGSKRTLAPRIVELLGAHKMYYEPFCGSMAVLLEKATCNYETVCDLHGDLINLARVLADPAKAVQLYDRLTSTLFSEELFLWCRQILNSKPEEREPVEWAWAFFVFSWAGRNGMSGSKRMSFGLAVRWTPNGGSASTRFRSAVESIPAWHDRLRNVVILQRTAWEVLPKIPDEPGIAVYCDPPYLLNTRGKGDADGGYRHEFSGIDHRTLARELARFKQTRVVVSYYADKWLNELYPAAAWDHLDAAITKNLANQNARGSKRGVAPEVLIVNKTA